MVCESHARPYNLFNPRASSFRTKMNIESQRVPFVSVSPLSFSQTQYTSSLDTHIQKSTTMATILTEDTVPSYLHENESKIGVFNSDSKIVAKSILGGNVNYAFRAFDENDETKSIFVKQAPEFVAIFGPDGLPLTSDRMKQEIAVYNEWRVILGSDTKFLPTIYCFDSEL